MKRNVLSKFHRADQEAGKHSTQVFETQVLMTAALVVAFVGLGVIELIAPSLWDYPFSLAFRVSLGNLAGYWPLFAAGLALSLWTTSGEESTGRDGHHLARSVALGAYAGVWEEMGYRCVFAAYAYILAAGSGVVVQVILIAACLIAAGYLICLAADGRVRVAQRLWFAAGAVVVGLLAWGIREFGNPFLVLYDWVMVPIYWLLTLGQLDALLHDPALRSAAIGLTFANAWFRKGHEYQGIVGALNSWFAGFVMIHATMSYGLWTAVVLHASYNAMVHTVHFVARRRHAAAAAAELSA